MLLQMEQNQGKLCEEGNMCRGVKDEQAMWFQNWQKGHSTGRKQPKPSKSGGCKVWIMCEKHQIVSLNQWEVMKEDSRKWGWVGNWGACNGDRRVYKFAQGNMEVFCVQMLNASQLWFRKTGPATEYMLEWRWQSWRIQLGRSCIV